MIFLPGPHVGFMAASRKTLVLCASDVPGPGACDALSFSLGHCGSEATKRASFKRFPFQAAMKRSSSLQSDSACPWALLFSRNQEAGLSSCTLSSSSSSLSLHPLILIHRIRVCDRQGNSVLCRQSSCVRRVLLREVLLSLCLQNHFRGDWAIK